MAFGSIEFPFFNPAFLASGGPTGSSALVAAFAGAGAIFGPPRDFCDFVEDSAMRPEFERQVREILGNDRLRISWEEFVQLTTADCRAKGRLPSQRAPAPGQSPEGKPVSFIGDLIGGIGETIRSGVQALPGIVQGAAVIGQGIRDIRTVFSGGVPMMASMTATGGIPMPMPAPMGMAGGGDQLSQYAAKLLESCGSAPSDACAADFNARLAAFVAASSGGGIMGVNPTTGSPMAGGPMEAGIGGVSLDALRRLAMTPGGMAALRALGLGALVTGAEAAGTAIGNFFTGGSGAMGGSQGPLLMEWPAMTRYPRSIVLRAPDKPEKRYRSEGTALLRSGDVAALRRVQRAASRARRRRGPTRRVSQPIYALPSSTHHVCGSCLTAPCNCK